MVETKDLRMVGHWVAVMVGMMVATKVAMTVVPTVASTGPTKAVMTAGLWAGLMVVKSAARLAVAMALRLVDNLVERWAVERDYWLVVEKVGQSVLQWAALWAQERVATKVEHLVGETVGQLDTSLVDSKGCRWAVQMVSLMVGRSEGSDRDRRTYKRKC